MCMTTKILKIKSGRVALPRELRKYWSQADVMVSGNRDTLVLKRMETTMFSVGNLSGLKSRLRETGKTISQKDIVRAVQSVRRRK